MVRLNVFVNHRRLGGTPVANGVNPAFGICSSRRQSARRTGYSNINPSSTYSGSQEPQEEE
jgi:hypothetical protein